MRGQTRVISSAARISANRERHKDHIPRRQPPCECPLRVHRHERGRCTVKIQLREMANASLGVKSMRRDR
jgi:hypothetical protein